MADLCARGPLWSIFAPLAVDADPVRMKEVVEQLRATHAPRDFSELSVALIVMATKDKRRRGLQESLLRLLSEEDVMQNAVYALGEQRGELKGELKAVVRGYERRLQRSLTEAERAVIARRMAALGMDRLLDVQHELSFEALAAWLADPAAG